MYKKTKIILLLIIILIISSCATTAHQQTYRQKQGLLMLDNTEMRINKKYHSKHNKQMKRKSARKYKRR